MTTVTAVTPETKPVRSRRRPIQWGNIGVHAFLITMAVVWLFPVLWAFYIALRSFADTTLNGYVAFPSSLTLDNFFNAWTQGDLARNYIQTLAVVIPGVILTLLIASMVAYACSRYSWRFNRLILMVFVAGNLLPQQVIIVPLYQLYLALPLPKAVSDTGVLYDQLIGILLIHIVFQMGFCIFVLSNYMKTLSKELTEAGLVDGASVLRIWWSIILPLCRPALAALATLEFTFIYNDFFWALLLIEKGAKRPITSALNNLQGQFFTDFNLLAACSVLVAIPTIVVYVVLQKQFIRGLTLGSTKG
jgi:multiple sugar transport system permease protein